MKATRFTNVLSIILVLSSLAALSFFGLNLGTDFKGGTKLVVAFKEGSDINRAAIEDAIKDVVEAKAETRDIQVEVTDYDTGALGSTGVTRRQIVIELVPIMSDKRRKEITSALQKIYPDNPTDVEVISEGEDKFFITFQNPVKITDAGEKKGAESRIKDIFTASERAQVSSEKKKDLDNEFYGEKNLLLREGANKLTIDALQESFEKRRDEILSAESDEKFEIKMEQLRFFLQKEFEGRFRENFVEIEDYLSLSASVGRTLFFNGLLAMIYAILGILLYVWVRFDIRYSPGAVLALIHDVSITLGIFSLLQIKFTLPIIAALLTVIGYSLNDTIVVYDRIRENTKRVQQRAMRDTVNASINATLSRTLLTSITTLLVVLSLLFLGGGQIQDFALALSIGIVVGTYSSVYVASPCVVILDKFLAKKESTGTGGGSRPKAA
jgi:preprotein translocase subunit SecF